MEPGQSKDGQPRRGFEGGLERTERNPFAVSRPIWARDKPAASPTRRRGGTRFAHALVLLGVLGIGAGLVLPWAAPSRYGTPIDLIRHGMLLDWLHDGLSIIHVVYLNVAALSLAGGLAVFFLLLMTLNRAMNIPVLTGCAWLLLALVLLAAALGLFFLFARQQVLDALAAGEPVTLGLYVWFSGLGLLLLGLGAEYVAHLRLAKPAGPSGLGRVL